MSARQRVRLTQREVDLLFGRVARNEARPLPARLDPRARLTPSRRTQQRIVGALLTVAFIAGYAWVSAQDFASAAGAR